MYQLSSETKSVKAEYLFKMTSIYNKDSVCIEYNDKTRRVILKKDKQWISMSLGNFQMIMSCIQIRDEFDMKVKIHSNPFSVFEITRLFGRVDLTFYNEGQKIYIAYLKFDLEEVGNLRMNAEFILNGIYSREKMNYKTLIDLNETQRHVENKEEKKKRSNTTKLDEPRGKKKNLEKIIENVLGEASIGNKSLYEFNTMTQHFE